MSKLGQYTRADVVETALRLLDQYGLADLSMRRIATELDIQPSALYWHVPNKQTLLALVADKIIERATVVDRVSFEIADTSGAAPDLDETRPLWKSVTLAEAMAVRNALLSFRDGAEVVSSTLALGLGAQEALTRIRSGLELICEQSTKDEGAGSVGVTSGKVIRIAANAILFLILGQVWHEQQRIQADSLGVTSTGVKPEDVIQPTNPDSLAFGIEMILDGLEKNLSHLLSS